MPDVADLALNPQIAAKIKDIFEDKIPFNKFLGFKLMRLERGESEIQITHREEFIGDAVKQILHGGVLCTLIDATGGAAAISVLDFPKELTVNTVDLRVDFLRPAAGSTFTAHGQVIRKGSRIVFTRVDVKSDRGELITSGTCNYSIYAPNAAGGPESQKAIIDLANG